MLLQQFLVINAVGLFLFTIWTLAAFRQPRMAWIVVSLAALMDFMRSNKGLLLSRWAEWCRACIP